MKRYALGLDFGTNSCRSLLVDLDSGAELGSAVYQYPSGHLGILTSDKDPNLARQNPRDYLDGLAAVAQGALKEAKKADPSFDPAHVLGIGVDTTGSTPIPVNAEGTPLALLDEFRDDLAAQVWLWKDHTAYEEAALITSQASKLRPQYLAKCGGVYSSEWFWSKVWHCQRTSPRVFAAAHSWVEHCDWIPALLTGDTRPEALLRSVCAAGHKALYCEEWGGLPDTAFLAALDPALASLRDRLYQKAHPAGTRAGGLSAEWAARLGLPEGIAVSVGAFDAHMGAVGAGVREGALVKILGTSTCDMTVSPTSKPLADIPGVCGVVHGSILPSFYGIEAGQSAVGDIFLWFVHHLVPDSYGATADEKFVQLAQQMAKLQPGESGLLALDWNNGNRTVLVDVRLTGLILGQTLHTKAHEIYRALIEATAFGALTIIRRMEEYGVRIDSVINTGGLAVKNDVLMQIYADILGRPLKVARSDQTCALGAALFGATASGQISLEDAQARTCGFREKVFTPVPQNQAVYAKLYELYRSVHDAFGTASWSGSLYTVMKRLLEIRDQARLGRS